MEETVSETPFPYSINEEGKVTTFKMFPQSFTEKAFTEEYDPEHHDFFLAMQAFLKDQYKKYEGWRVESHTPNFKPGIRVTVPPIGTGKYHYYGATFNKKPVIEYPASQYEEPWFTIKRLKTEVPLLSQTILKPTIAPTANRNKKKKTMKKLKSN